MSFLSREVFDYRRRLLNGLMDQAGLDGFVVFEADFFQFFSNFHVDVQTWERPIALVLPRNGEPVAIMNALSTGHVGFAKERGSLWIEDVRIYCEFPLDPRDTRTSATFLDLLIDAVADCGLSDARLGMDSRSLWPGDIAASFPSASFRAMVPEVRALRWVKHDEEISIMKELCALSDWVQELYFEEVRPGRLIHELDYFIAKRLFEKAADLYPGENLEYRFYTLSGPSSASPHGDGGQVGKRLERGHGLVNIIIPRLNGVTIENERTLFVGEPSDLQKRAYDAAMRANRAAVEQMVAGNEVQAIDAAARRVICDAGFHENLLHRTGHGMGLVGHEFPADMAYNTRPLLENEVYSAEPGIFIKGVGGFRVDDTVVIGTNAPMVLTSTPRALEDVILCV